MEEKKICPYCGGEIKAVAKKCWHCGKWLENENIQSSTDEESITKTFVTNKEEQQPEQEEEQQPESVYFKQSDEQVIQVAGEQNKENKIICLLISEKAIFIYIVVALLIITTVIAIPYINDYMVNAAYDQTEAVLRKRAQRESTEKEKIEREKREMEEAEEAEEAAKKAAEEEKRIIENRERILKEVSKKYTLVGSIGDDIYYLKGKKSKYEPKLYSQSIIGSAESSYSLTQFYDGSMNIQDFAVVDNDVVIIVNETDRNSTGFLEATLVLRLNTSTDEWRDVYEGGCVKAEFSSDKTKVKITSGYITNPDAVITADYKYDYSTEEIEL